MGAVEPAVAAVTLRDGRKRRIWSKQQRLKIVEETLKPGASVSLVARAHDVNANQLFKWRKLYREGRLEVTPASSTPGTLLSVKISDSPPVIRSTQGRRRAKPRQSGVIDIDLGHARVRIEGSADPACVRATLEGLLQ
jgi:transposase